MKIVLIVLSAAMMISCVCDPEDREPRNRDNVDQERFFTVNAPLNSLSNQCIDLALAQLLCFLKY